MSQSPRSGLQQKTTRKTRGEETDTMVARSHKCIIPKVAADVCLDHFAADSIAWDEVFILTACHYGSWGNVCVKGPWEWLQNSDGPREENENSGQCCKKSFRKMAEDGVFLSVDYTASTGCSIRRPARKQNSRSTSFTTLDEPEGLFGLNSEQTGGQSWVGGR